MVVPRGPTSGPPGTSIDATDSPVDPDTTWSFWAGDSRPTYLPFGVAPTRPEGSTPIVHENFFVHGSSGGRSSEGTAAFVGPSSGSSPKPSIVGSPIATPMRSTHTTAAMMMLSGLLFFRSGRPSAGASSDDTSRMSEY